MTDVLVSKSGGLTDLDWIVIAAYGLAMILVGVHGSRRNKSSDDYLLGGRRMRHWMVGLSMFATFLSVLTYLATPGEMIRHGPMMLGWSSPGISAASPPGFRPSGSLIGIRSWSASRRARG